MWEWLPWDNGFVGMGLAVRERGWFLSWLFFSGSPGRVINSGRMRGEKGRRERLGVGEEKEAEKKKKEKEKQKEIEILRERERLYSHLYPHWWMEFTGPSLNQKVLSGSSLAPSVHLRSFSSGPCPDRYPSSLLSLGWTRTSLEQQDVMQLHSIWDKK